MGVWRRFALGGWCEMPISFDTQPSELGFYFTNLAIFVEKHQPPGDR